ncbi:MAG: PfkB family carbohydrate kinase [Candidatus Poseidoniaceae archaeon]|jgi:sugar/nucleoside kinase (ribokinase family)|nr:PfkB family carbohydrate kinase [Candidatus Poseidoniaceae archaeon]
MDVLIVGSLAYDSLETPSGIREDELGGSASYGGFSAAFHNKRLSGNGIGIVGVVGEDFVDEHMEWYVESGIDISGIEIVQGKTFRWRGSYHGDMSEAITHETQLNAFEDFIPKIPSSIGSPKVVMCANLVPSIQKSVLDQTNPTRLTILDSMNLWIEIAKEELLSVIKRVEILVLNDGEVKMLAENDNLIQASFYVHSLMGNGILVVKRGEHGVIAIHPEGIVSIPAYPTTELVDPTGCGDTFAGAMAAELSQRDGEVTKLELAEALVHATITASFTIEQFGTGKIRALNIENYNSRLISYREMTRTNTNN